jgi:hypothetical protein
MGKGFEIADNKGFRMTFKNGLTLSVQFGYGNYCDNHNIENYDHNNYGKTPMKSDDAEIAIWMTDNMDWVTKYFYGNRRQGDDVMGYQTPENVAEIITILNSFETKEDFEKWLLLQKITNEGDD